MTQQLLTGRTDNFPKDVVFNAGVIMAGSTPAVKGTTMGGIKFDPGKEIRQLGYDGQAADVVGGDRIVRWKPKLSFTLQELGDSTTGNQLALIEAGSTQSDIGHQSTSKGRIRLLTPKAAGVLFVVGDYIANLIGVFEIGGAGIYQYARIQMDYALCTKYDVQTSDSAEGKINVEVEARLSASDAVNSPGKCPYVLELSENLPS